MTKKRNISAMIAFCVLAAGFVVMNWLDSEYMWDTLMGARYRGLLRAWWNADGGFSSFMYIIYRIDDMETVYSIFTSFPGCFFTVLPLLAVVFTVMKKKIPAGIFAVLNLLFSALIIVLFVVYNGVANASWIAYAVASVVLMLFALQVIRRKTLTGRLCFALGIVAAVVSVMLSADIDWYRFFMTLPGVLFAAFPLLAVGFAGKRKKIPAVIFAALNLLFTGLLFVVDSVVFSACWAVYAAAGVVLLLYALGVIQRKTLPVILFFALGAASVAATVKLSFYEVGFRHGWLLREARVSAFERYGMRAIWDVKRMSYVEYASTLYPLSRAFLYFALGAGALAFRGKEEPRKVNRPVQAVRPVVMQLVQPAATSAAESLKKLEQLARLHDMGALTDEEFAQKKEELLKRM